LNGACGRAIALALALVAPLLADSGNAGVRVRNGAGLVLASFPSARDFTLGYVHSINLSPVDERFLVPGDGTLVLDRVTFDQLSTGMPSGDEDGFAVENGRFVTRPGRVLDRIALRVSPVPGHEMRIGGRVLPLTRWAPPGGLLYLEAGRRKAP